jgi:hypothetical protein
MQPVYSLTERTSSQPEFPSSVCSISEKRWYRMRSATPMELMLILSLRDRLAMWATPTQDFRSLARTRSRAIFVVSLPGDGPLKFYPEQPALPVQATDRLSASWTACRRFASKPNPINSSTLNLQQSSPVAMKASGCPDSSCSN